MKIHCSILAEDAIKAAVADYKQKHGADSAHGRRRPVGARGTAGSRLRETRHGSDTDRERGEARRRFLTKRGKGVGLRLGVRTTGCSGLAYKLEYADDVRPGRHHVREPRRQGGRRPEEPAYLDGTELDFAREGLNEGFKFNNPNVKDECGCGESFNV